MKAELLLARELVDQIADKVIEKLKPIIPVDGKIVGETIYTPETLAEYLQVDTSWVYRQVSEKNIPYFKNGKYVRFRKSSIDRWISSHERQPIPKFKQIKHGKVNS